MKLIKPFEISARILTLLDESDERVILVSPYMKIAKWYRLRKKLITLKDRGIPMEFYVRDDPENFSTYKDLDELDLPYFRIPHLHTKLYLNEKYGIVSSMNLLLSSELNSLEIGYETESWKEYGELKAYYLRHIRLGDKTHVKNAARHNTQDSIRLIGIIEEGLKYCPGNFWFWFDGSGLHIQTGKKKYHVLLHDRCLRITVRLRTNSGIKKTGYNELSLKAGIIKNVARMKIKVQMGNVPGFVDIMGQTSVPLSSVHIGGILDKELKHVTDTIINFILAVEELIPGQHF